MLSLCPIVIRPIAVVPAAVQNARKDVAGHGRGLFSKKISRPSFRICAAISSLEGPSSKNIYLGQGTGYAVVRRIRPHFSFTPCLYLHFTASTCEVIRYIESVVYSPEAAKHLERINILMWQCCGLDDVVCESMEAAAVTRGNRLGLIF